MGREQETLRRLVKEVQTEGRDVEQIIHSIVSQYTNELDDLVDRIDQLIKDLRNDDTGIYEERDLELDIIGISSLMYRASKDLAFLGSHSDIAKAKKLELYNKAVLAFDGTVAERKAKADKYVESEQLVEDIFKRAYDQLKIKLEGADRVYSALKKVYTKRLVELEVFRKELTQSRTGGGTSE